jgi:hypothetical protein
LAHHWGDHRAPDIDDKRVLGLRWPWCHLRAKPLPNFSIGFLQMTTARLFKVIPFLFEIEEQNRPLDEFSHIYYASFISQLLSFKKGSGWEPLIRWRAQRRVGP